MNSLAKRFGVHFSFKIRVHNHNCNHMPSNCSTTTCIKKNYLFRIAVVYKQNNTRNVAFKYFEVC